MKIAVATVDGTSMSQHFGQSAGFIVFDVEGKTIQQRELRSNQQTPHDEGICQHGAGGAHSHSGIGGLIGDCTMVLCGGMGGGAAQALMQQGIRPVILPIAGSADDLVTRYLEGTIDTAPAGFCNCQH
jgi:predicted Fe-Mo cluster-binding NifX family protein